MKKNTPTPPNYQKQLDQILAQLPAQDAMDAQEGGNTGSGRKKRLLLHACCAPCSSAVLEYLAAYFDITLYFYNPNIATEAEFTHRASELKRLLCEMGLSSIPVLTPPYHHEEFLSAAKGLEQEPERGKRCRECFSLRLRKTAEAARDIAKNNPKEAFGYICTTLSISPLKDAVLLNTLGTEIATEYRLSYLPSDFKKRGRYQRSIELSKEHGLYRQNFCGCEFSQQKQSINPSAMPDTDGFGTSAESP